MNWSFPVLTDYCVLIRKRLLLLKTAFGYYKIIRYSCRRPTQLLQTNCSDVNAFFFCSQISEARPRLHLLIVSNNGVYSIIALMSLNRVAGKNWSIFSSSSLRHKFVFCCQTNTTKNHKKPNNQFLLIIKNAWSSLLCPFNFSLCHYCIVMPKWLLSFVHANSLIYIW